MDIVTSDLYDSLQWSPYKRFLTDITPLRRSRLLVKKSIATVIKNISVYRYRRFLVCHSGSSFIQALCLLPFVTWKGKLGLLHYNSLLILIFFKLRFFSAVFLAASHISLDLPGISLSPFFEY